MKVYKIYPIGFAANCYLLTQDGKSAVAIDPAQPRVLAEAQARGLQITHVLLTHGHFDHIGGCEALQAAGAKIGCLHEEVRLLGGADTLAARFGAPVPAVRVDFTLRDGDRLLLNGISIQVLATPGHTAGGACYLAEGELFTGDTLFAGSVGRTDFPTGDAQMLRQSLQKLAALPQDLRVRPGHEGDSTLAQEKMHNGWMRQC